MNLPEQLLAQAEEFRIYAAAECKPASKEQWIKWAETCEAASERLLSTARHSHESTAQFKAEEIATGFIHMILTHQWDKDQMTRILEAWMAKGIAECPAALRLKGLRKLMGHVEDGSHSTVTLFQDDATKDFFVKNEQRSFYASSFEGAIDAATQ